MMNCKELLALCGLVLAMPNVQAITISASPVVQEVQEGGSLTVLVNATGVNAGSTPSISVFDFDFTYDGSLLAFRDATFGDQLDLFGLGSDTAADGRGPGIINLFELSFDSAFDLDDRQTDTFTLVSLRFDILAAGTSDLTLHVNALGDAFGDPLGANVVNGSVQILSAVPVPGALGLFALGTLVWGGASLRWRGGGKAEAGIRAGPHD